MMKKELYGLVVGDAVRVTDGKYKTGRGHVIDIFPETMEVELFLVGAFNAKTAIVSVLDTESL